MKGTEERDNLFARLFGLTAVVESGILFQSKATLEDFKLCFGELMALGEKKSWIRESAWWTVTTGVKSLLNSEVTWREDAVKALLQRMYGTTGDDESSKKHRGMEWTQDKAAMTLILQEARPVSHFPFMLFGRAETNTEHTCLSGFELESAFVTHIQERKYFVGAELDYSRKTLEGEPNYRTQFRSNKITNTPVSAFVKETNESIEPVAPSGAPTAPTLTTGSWKPKVHFIWDTILNMYLGEDAKKTAVKDKAPFQEFYRVTVDGERQSRR